VSEKNGLKGLEFGVILHNPKVYFRVRTDFLVEFLVWLGVGQASAQTKL